MRPPAFWSRHAPSAEARLLSPLAAAYGAISGRRMLRQGVRAAVPVVCIGNFTLGGAGKTPTALAVATILQEAGERPAFLTRGYGGRLAGPVLVQPHHDAAEVGDEPLLLARAAATVVARDRPAGARLAVEAGATVLVMDDGLQNPSLQKDFALAVVDGGSGLGNGLVVPAGPLRAPLPAQWRRIDAVLVIGAGAPGDEAAARARNAGRRVLRGELVVPAGAAARVAGRTVLAFAGIGRPEKFFESLRACGAILAESRSFPDHHVFTADEIESLGTEARRRGLLLVTTEKDAARARRHASAWTILPVQLEAEDLQGAVLDAVARRRAPSDASAAG
jgi:tetraacyldisaccharide 4'-kinase